MQVVRGNAKVAVFRWRDAEFAPQRVDVLLLVVDTGELHHVEAASGVSTVRADKVVERDLDLGGSASDAQRVGLGSFAGNATLEPCLVCTEVSASQLVVEEQLDIRRALQRVEEGIV